MKSSYNKEYRVYLETYKSCPSIMPSFMVHLRHKRDEAAEAQNWTRYQYWSELIQEDIEDSAHSENMEQDGPSDADPGL